MREGKNMIVCVVHGVRLKHDSEQDELGTN